MSVIAYFPSQTVKRKAKLELERIEMIEYILPRCTRVVVEPFPPSVVPATGQARPLPMSSLVPVAGDMGTHRLEFGVCEPSPEPGVQLPREEGMEFEIKRPGVMLASHVVGDEIARISSDGQVVGGGAITGGANALDVRDARERPHTVAGHQAFGAGPAPRGVLIRLAPERVL